MAEVLAVVGGIAAVVQLATSARRCARFLRRFAADAGGAADEVERFAIQIKTFSDTIGVSQFTISSFCNKNPRSPMVAFIASHRVIENIINDAEHVQNHLEAIQDQVEGISSRFPLLVSIMWAFRKSSFRELYPEMESVKTSLSLLMLNTQLAATLAKQTKGDSLKSEIRALKSLLKSHLKTTAILQPQLHHVRQQHGTAPSSAFRFGSQNALLDLGRSMYDHGTVPESRPFSPSISEHSLGPDSRPSTPRDFQKSGFHQHPPPYVSRSSLPGPRRNPLAPARRLPPPSPASRPPPNHTEPPGPRKEALRLDHTTLTSSISGYIISPHGTPRQVTALVASNCSKNVISIHEARRHGLDIRMPGVVLMDFGLGLEMSVGRAVLRWGKVAHKDQRYPPLVVECEVCENSEVGLMLGWPFLEERSRKWEKRELSEDGER